VIPILLVALARPPSTGELDAPPRIELITIGAPRSSLDSLDSPWGESALRIYDPKDGSDLAYEPSSSGFARRPFPELIADFASRERTVTRRILALPPPSARSLATRIGSSSSSAVTDIATSTITASTRIRDELDVALGGALRSSARPLRGTLRARLLDPLRDRRLAYLILDLAFTGWVDRPSDAYEAALMPEGLAKLIQETTIEGRPLVEDEFDAYRAPKPDPDVSWTWPWTTVYILFVAPLVFAALAWPRRSAIAETVLACVLLSVLVRYALAPAAWFGGSWALLIFVPLCACGIGARRAPTAWAIDVAAVLIGLALFETGMFAQAIGPAFGVVVPIRVARLIGGAGLGRR
jgi:hypothetical protein